MSWNIDREYESADLDSAFIEATYSDEYGGFIEKVKYRLADGDKTFRCFFSNPLDFKERQGCGLTKERLTTKEWRDNEDVLGKRPSVPLFRQADVEAKKGEAPVVVVTEGEECAKISWLLDLPGTTNFDGAGKWAEHYNETFKDAGVAIFQDEDNAGVAHALKVAQALSEVAEWVKIVRLPGLAPKGDLRDWYNSQKALGCDDKEIRAALLSIVNATPKWSPVVVADGQLVAMIDRTERELVDRLSGVYVRGNQLVKAVKTETPTFKQAKTRTYKMMPLSADSLRETMGRCMVFKKIRYVKEKAEDGTTTSKKTLVPTNPPRDVAQTLLASGRGSALPEIAGIVSCPTLRPNGTVLDREGYDAGTGLLVLEPLELPKDMPANPSKDHALAALAKLDALLDGFPFKTEADRSAALSLLMTPVLRPCMDAAPLHAVSANGAGVGKSYLADIAAAIATGERAPVTASGWSLEEMEKRLTGPLLDGSPFIALDNLDKFPIAGDFLCQAVERPRLSLRALGTTGNREISNRSFMCATGINIVIKGDMLRRCLLISLDTDNDRPELRKFNFDPLAMVLKDRPVYVAAVLTIARAYIVAQHPEKRDALGSFGQWSDNVRSALVWLGRDDPLDTMTEARKGDDSLNAFAEFMDAWWACSAVGDVKETPRLRAVDLTSDFCNSYGADREKMSADKMAEFDRNARLHEAVRAFGNNSRDQLTKISLGKALQKHNGAVVNGMKLMSVYDTNRHVHSWYIKRIERNTSDSELKIAA